MLNFLSNQIIFYAVIVFVLFLPGYFLLLAIFGRRGKLELIERFIISLGLSIISVDFIFFSFSRLGIRINPITSLLGIGGFIAVCFLMYKKFSKTDADQKDSDFFKFSRNQYILLIFFTFLAIFIKVAYLSGTVLPSATDMGHHMYWAKWMVDNGQLPTYEGMPDFIIGEHIIFGVIAILSGASFFSAFPPVILFLANILSILAVFILVMRIFGNKNIAIFSLLFLGVLYAVSSPQAKFVSGGVIGNIIGNLLMPLAFYLYYRAFEFYGHGSKITADEKTFLALAIFVTTGLFYTHHLTSFIFLFVFAFVTAVFFAINYKDWKNIFSSLGKIVFSARVLATFALCIIFFFFVFTPNYAQPSAVDKAVGNPVKETRVGLSFDNIRSTVGEARVALGFFGLLLLLIFYKKKNFGYAVVAAWAVMLFLMSAKPNWLFIDLPSARIGNYLSYPLAILSAYGFVKIFEKYPHNFLVKGAFYVLLGFAFVNGISDSATAFKNQNNATELAQTFNASKYLAENISDDDVVLKDHNYIAGDSWIKLFFMRGYKYPLSRGYFKRYEDQINQRETCTLEMISNPNGQVAQQCFSETGTNLIMVNPLYDSAQFKKLHNFNLIYANEGISIFYRK